jgi:hypothetical protein
MPVRLTSVPIFEATEKVPPAIEIRKRLLPVKTREIARPVQSSLENHSVSSSKEKDPESGIALFGAHGVTGH